MLTTYGLRNHELWQVEGFAGENAFAGDAIAVADLMDEGDGQVKT